MIKKYAIKLDFWYILKVGVLILIYFLTAKLGLSFYALHGFATTLWPLSGIALAFLIIYGYSLWPGITIAAFAINLMTGSSPFVALGIAIGNTLEALLATYLLCKYVNLYRCFERLPDTLRFIGIVTIVGATTSATIGVTSIWLGDVIDLYQAPATWFAWWIGNSVSALIMTPFLLTCLVPTRTWNKDSLSWLEIMAGYSFLIISNLIIFWYPVVQLKTSLVLYLILFPLIWSGIRFGSRGMTSSILITSIIAVWSTIYGRGPFIINPINDGFLYMQIFLGTISVIFLIFLSIVKERRLFMLKLKEHVDELEHALQKISAADEAKNDFLAILAHELRNPLAPVVSSLELMKIRIEEKVDVINLIKIIETHVYTISHLLDDLLDISKISRKKLKLEKETFLLKDVIEKSLETVNPAIKFKEHSVTVSLPEKNLYLEGDPIRIEQIIVNMLINAVKYTDPRGQINLTCTTEDDIVIISIKDNGIGIARDILTQVFEPFFQAKTDTAGAGSGLGVGLSLSKKLAELHNGSIIAKSEGVGKGSEFIMRLPIPKNIQLGMDIKINVDQTFDLDKKAIVSYKKYKILVIDDNIPAAEALSELLRYKGHEVKSSYEGETVLDIIRDFNPDIVVLDIGLSDISGYEVARRIRSQIGRRIQLVALTGYGQKSDKLKALKAGFDHHLTKPISISDLEKILNNL